MASDPTPSWRPDWSVAPGEILLEALQDRRMTQAELSRRMARPLKTINEIIKGKAAITPETAIQLERTLGISATFWTHLETMFREQAARQAATQELEANVSWVDGFPIKDLQAHDLLPRATSKAGLLAELLLYLRISGPAAFDRQWLDPAAAFRSSPAFMASPKAVAAWLRWGEIESGKVLDLPALNLRRFRDLLDEIRVLTRRGPFPQIVDRVKAMCAAAGVILVVTPEFKDTHLSGATRWLGGRPVIQLNLRHKSTDHFWFTFFHEAGHVLTSARRQEFVDDEDLETTEDLQGAEEAANRFARDLLLPQADYQEFAAAGDFSREAVRAFAENQGVAPGIVVGRLQRDGRMPPSHLNDLKRPISWGR
jgi:HTH-type transcriptional regulator/antitoxin HigA